MADPALKQVGSLRRCAGVLSRVAYQRAKRQGIDVEPLIKQTGLTTREIEDSKASVGVSHQIKFVELVADALGDRFLGFHLARDFEFREMGLLYYVAASANTLGDGLLRIERYVRIQNEGVRFKVTKGKAVRVSIHYYGVARHTDVHQIGAFIGLVIQMFRHLTNRPLTPLRVRLMNRIADGKHELERFLNCVIADDAGTDEIEFPAASWDLPLMSADPYLQRLCVQNCEKALAHWEGNRSPLKVKVENTIAMLLPHGPARYDLVATQLGMSPRTLARRLSSEGSSFAEILEKVRSALAQRYLADRALPISEIAWLLGYAEISAFTRAFHRWTGMSPRAARARQGPAAGRTLQQADRGS